DRRQLFFAATKGGREKVERLLRELEVPFAADADALRDEIVITGGSLARGFEFEDVGLAVYSEWDLFEPPTSTRIGGRKRASEAFVTDLRDLKVGDYIVHVDHGVGRFLGLQRIPFGPTEREVMEIEYSGGGKLLMPMESLNLIQKYSGGTDTQPRLDKLGGTAWARTKASVKKAMRDMGDELLTRYYSAKEQKEIVKKLESGEIDVVIGTHRLLSKDIAFKDLGLLVIDEEQRFGVGQKERLKQLKKAIDVVAMSATPIPRTLNMSLIGIRDISVIETPPKDRLAIQTAVVPFNDDF